MKKVIVGISGGVDSAVAAILLKEQGYDVEGLFMRNWDSSINNDILGNPDINNDICPQEQDYNDALDVCKKLGIKLHRIDFIKEYWDNVFTYFLDELKKGRTPNPDIMCNKYIKFDVFIKEAKRLGADFIATGHYAKMEDGYLKKADNLDKDQTYFLSQLSHKQLENVLFPLGNIKNKQEVRDIASKYDLKIASKKDSTGICFIGERNFKNFLKNYLPAKQGDVIDIATDKVVGKHEGLMYYTIGQRRGLNIGGSEDKMFVVGKNLDKNVLYISYGDTDYLYSDSAIVEDINFNSDLRPESCNAKFRYRQEDIPVELEYLDDGNILVKYDKVKAVTPGQACVFYVDDICIGGGIIKEVRKNDKKLWYLL